MKYNFTIKKYKLDFNTHNQNQKTFVIVHNYVWTFKELCNYVSSNDLITCVIKSYFHPLHKVPYHDYSILFIEKLGDNDCFVHKVTVNKIVDGKIIDFDWRKFEGKLKDTEFFKLYEAKRRKRGKEAITHSVVGI